jgi:hypothetical protein
VTWWMARANLAWWWEVEQCASAAEAIDACERTGEEKLLQQLNGA